MRRLVILATVLAFVTPAFAAEGQVNFFWGRKFLSREDWAPVEQQAEFGVEFTLGGKKWPVAIALDWLEGTESTTIDTVFFRSETTEIAVGVRKIWTPKFWRPFLGGGIAFVDSVVRDEFSSDNDSGVGFWATTGVFFRVFEHFNIGIEYRYSRADVELFDFSANAGGSHVGLLVGFGP